MFVSGLETQADLNRLLDRLCGSDERVLERAVVTTGELVQQRFVRLARLCTPPLLGEAAREELQQLRPSLQEALGALEDIEGRRGLTDEELAKRHAFTTLLTVRV